MHTVKFKAAGREVQAGDGEVLLDAAKRHGIHIDSSCGGNGSCHQCRVFVRAGHKNLQRGGAPAEPRYRKDGEPVFLACQGEVRGDLEVDPAPIADLQTDHPVATLLGWNVGGGCPLRVLDPGSFTGGDYEIDADGGFVRVSAFPAGERDDADAFVVGRDAEYADCLRAGVSHLPDVRAVLDFSGRVLDTRSGAVEPVPTNAFAGRVPHLPGAIDYVEWSPLKTRTVITTVQGEPPTGLSATGVMSCVVALIRAGMCGTDLQLKPSRFTREVGGRLAAMIVGPGDEAQSPQGVIFETSTAITLGQGQLNAIRDAATVIADKLAGLEGVVVTTGDYGAFVPDDFIRALGIRDGEIEFVPHAAALGAARLAFQ